MGRVFFSDTCTVPTGPNGSLVPLAGIAYVPFHVNTDGSEGSQASAFEDRTSAIAAPTLATDASGSIGYWLDAGDYNIHVSDQQAPARIAPVTRGFTAPIIDTNELVVAAQNLIQFTGDLKYSMQSADHGLKSDGSYEWLRVNSDADGGGRKLDHVIYNALWTMLGSPAPDGTGKFRLPNISGRALVASGAATGLTARNLLDVIGAETHTQTIPALTVPALSIPGLSIPSLSVASHSHALTNAGGAAIAFTENGPGAFTMYFTAQNNGFPSLVGPSAEALRNVPLGSGGSADNFENSVPLVGATGAGSSTTGTGTTGSGSTGTGVTGSGTSGSGSSMQPSFGMNLFVKT